ncbi:unnamed protein product [Oppiella nova]|uniref:Nuclear receptor domain-containing protein n=1 Tax=Oppiella nova TaxID=334625 RepID=A0A7R9LV84_9ACAR|nr:unnamed protein product [Oppiella nova]CAG2167281.1 unnamed protein product [Oppiella nova]
MSKVCVICEDIAYGNNFGTLSCNSCKTFFRRNAIKTKIFTCLSNGKCEITYENRGCIKCRLEKCYALGMRKDWIIDERIKRFRRVNSDRRRRSERLNDRRSHGLTLNEMCDENKGRGFGANICGEMVFKMITDFDTSCHNINTQMKRFYENFYNKTAHKLVANHSVDRPIADYSNQLTELEANKLSELLDFSRGLRRPLDKTITEMIGTEDVKQALVLLFTDSLNHLVNGVKSLSEFKDFCGNDQISLVKYGCLDVINIRSVLFYDFRSQSFALSFKDFCGNDQISLVKYGCLDVINIRSVLFYDFRSQSFALSDNNSSHLKLDSLQVFKSDIYSPYLNFMHKIAHDWDSDPVVIDLLTAMLLFNPNRPNLMHKDSVNQTEMRNSVAENPQEYGPLIRELFDMKG